jgi:3',5'-cyclic AMP phosphodiesterase CpdA
MSIGGGGGPRRFASVAAMAPVEVQVRHGVRQNQPIEPLPPPTGRPPFRVELADVLGTPAVDAIAAAGRLAFHVAGDTGGTAHPVPQQIVAIHMENDLAVKDDVVGDEQRRPRFFYHLGDVVYYYGQASGYYAQFYEPYQRYDAPILPIPGNHDGAIDLDLKDQVVVRSLAAFVRNFCASWPHVTPEAGDVNRDAMTLPNVYWTLRAPFVTIVGLYSNVPGGGFIDDEQAAWLAEELKAAPPQAALIVALHHPIFSASGEKIGNTCLGERLDDAAKDAGRLPDMVLTGHVHNYQRFTRHYQQREIPYLVLGAGGHWHLNPVAKHGGKELPQPWKVPDLPVCLERYKDDRHGYLRLTATATTLHGEYVTVPRPCESWHNGPVTVFDAFTLDLQHHRLSGP